MKEMFKIYLGDFLDLRVQYCFAGLNIEYSNKYILYEMTTGILITNNTHFSILL